MFHLHAILLPFGFDAPLMLAELAAVHSGEWIGHYKNDEYEGEWAVAALRSVGGHPAVVHSVPGARQEGFYKNTPLLERCPYLKSVIGGFGCAIGAARLMRLGPGARILEHCDDMGAGSSHAELRIHIPIQTGPGVAFWVDHQLVPMQAGETWYADFSMPHRVDNNSGADRVHLVLDCEPNEWLLARIRKGAELVRITSFLQNIGIECTTATLPENTFLPGVDIHNGGILIDPERLQHPGDILHEAGHIAVVPAQQRAALSGNVGEDDPNAMGNEIAAILWSYAALRAIGLPEETVFHEQGYKGQSDWHMNNFQTGNYIGLPLLEWMGLCAGPAKAEATGLAPFPAMTAWLRA